MQLILRPIITEKSMSLPQMGKYVFEVHPDTNKIEIAKAVSRLYKVKVESVNIMNKIGKERKWKGRISGKNKNWKKAIVTVKHGQKIEGFEIKEEKKTEKKSLKANEKAEKKPLNNTQDKK